jgi:hypothetical protein
MSVLDNIITKYKYPNLYQRQVYNETTRAYDNKFGFHTNEETKAMLIDRGTRYINEEAYTFKVNDKETIREMMTYIIDTQNGKSVYTAVEGAHDDRVISFLGALLIADDMMPPPVEIITKKKKTKPNRTTADGSRRIKCKIITQNRPA